jgi:WhiB family redox-sensing transcriptional regulator
MNHPNTPRSPDKELLRPTQEGENMLELLIQTDDAWRVDGRCNDNAGTMTHLFFSDKIHHISRAKAICAKCAVATECLDAAERRRERWGVWGGELIENGRIVRNKRGRGRPPKHPRPEVLVDEVPVPPGLVTA